MFTSRFNDAKWLDYARDAGLISQEIWDDCAQGLKEGKPRGRIVEADYSALEVVTLAMMSGDENLIRMLKEGTDMHCARLAKSLGEEYESVLAKVKDEQHPEHKKYKTLRTRIKGPSFAYQYGASAYGISWAAGISVEEAQAFIDNEKALFPGVEKWYEEVVYKTVESNFTRVRQQMDDGSYRLAKIGQYVSPAGTIYKFPQVQKSQWVDGERVSQMVFDTRKMRNYPIQGEASFIVQVIAGMVVRWVISKEAWRGKVFIINQVHDAIYADVYEPVLKPFCKGLKKIMESVPETMEEFGYNNVVPFPVEVEAGLDMFEKHHVEVE